MEQFWTWGGEYIGVRKDDYLWCYSGKVLGKFYGHELYNADGLYIGEINRENRIIVNTRKRTYRRPAFSKGIAGCVSMKYREIPVYPLLTGYADFKFEP